MYSYEVGKKVEGLKLNREGTRFDITNGGATLTIGFNSPTEEEINAIKNGDFKMKLYNHGDILMTLFKFEGIPWMDAPYNVHLSKNLDEIKEFEDGKGLALTVYFIDVRTQILQAMRLFGLNTRLSNKIKEFADKQRDMEFDQAEYDKNLIKLFNNYSTKDLVKRSI